MEIQNQREEQLEDLRRKREAFVQVRFIDKNLSNSIGWFFFFREKITKF